MSKKKPNEESNEQEKAKRRVQWARRIFGDASVTIAQWRRARDFTNLGNPQVPGSIPAETPSTQINMDLSK